MTHRQNKPKKNEKKARSAALGQRPLSIVGDNVGGENLVGVALKLCFSKQGMMFSKQELLFSKHEVLFSK